jgi:muramoyltetrapeptide carboxypeptidase LdcA involved in peptidoglycan recycling
LLEPLGCRNSCDLIKLIQSAVGDGYRVTGDTAQIEADERDDRGGRFDDAARAREITRTLADDRIAAAISLRGGAWLTRIVPRIDFNVLRDRRQRIALFGFSELTPLLNIAAGYSKVCAYHDYCPGFIKFGLRDYAREHAAELAGRKLLDDRAVDQFSDGWAAARFRADFAGFFRDVVGMLEGKGSVRSLTLRRVRGSLRGARLIKVVGGNLSTMITLLSSPYRRVLRPNGRWLLIEDTRELPERIDRMLSHLTLQGWLSRYEGILVGVFRHRQKEITDSALACLNLHLGRGGPPVLVTRDIGHVWPMAPLPIGRAIAIRSNRSAVKGSSIGVHVPWSNLRVCRREGE